MQYNFVSLRTVLSVNWVGGAFCVASYVHGHHNVGVSLIHGECCRLSAREKLDKHDNTDIIS